MFSSDSFKRRTSSRCVIRSLSVSTVTSSHVSPANPALPARLSHPSRVSGAPPHPPPSHRCPCPRVLGVRTIKVTR
jgi:hypothetical protein